MCNLVHAWSICIGCISIAGPCRGHQRLIDCSDNLFNLQSHILISQQRHSVSDQTLITTSFGCMSEELDESHNGL